MKLRFSIRDLLWVALVVALLIGWRVDRSRQNYRLKIAEEIEYFARWFAIRAGHDGNPTRGQVRSAFEFDPGNFKMKLANVKDKLEQYIKVIEELQAEEN